MKSKKGILLFIYFYLQVGILIKDSLKKTKCGDKNYGHCSLKPENDK